MRKKAVAEIRASGGQADFISSDLRDASSARQVARSAVELGNGNVDILINNAGVFPFGPTHETSEELFDKVYSLNVRTCPVDGEKGQRSRCKCLHNGCGLWGIRHEPLRIKQSRDKPANESVDG